MTTVTLHPGTVNGIAGSGLGSIVGSGAIWNDASDATYLDGQGSLATGNYTGRAVMDTLSLPAGATVTGVTGHIRVQALSTSATPARVGATLHPAGGFSTSFTFESAGAGAAGWTIPSLGSILDLSLDVDAAQLADSFMTLSDLADLLALPATLDIRPTAPSSGSGVVRIRVYEFSVDVTYSEPATTGIPQLRLTNRNFGLSRADYYRQGGNRLTGPL